MKRVILGLAAVAAIVAGPALASTRTYFGFQIGVGSAPPPPTIVVHGEPECRPVPGSRVYVVEEPDADYDFFRYGPYWYVCSGEYWYRSRRYDGPFAVVDVRYVPRPVFYVPEKHWKHHRPGHWEGYHEVGVVKVKHGKGHGHDHAHWKD